MSISGYYFKFDNISSKPYHLIIANIKTNSTETVIDGKKEYQTMMLQNRFHIMDRKIKEPLTFEMEIVSDTSNLAITDNQHRAITKWLFDRMQYHKLEIMSETYEDVYFNCTLTESKKYEYGVGLIGYYCTVTCDASWAWEREKTNSYTITSSPYSFNFINTSDDEDTMHPYVVITCGSTGGTISITNLEDVDDDGVSNVIQFTGLSANEVITIDNLGQVTSSTGNSKYDTWNHNRLNLISGDNHITITGDVTKLAITYQNARRIGV